MDLYRHLQVLWRFKGIIATGVILGVAVAILATFEISPQGVSYREPEVWTSTSQLLVTQAGFPWGRTILPGAPLPGGDVSQAAAREADSPAFADPSRLGYLSVVYSNFLMGDEIKTMMKRPPAGGQIVAAPLRDGTASNAAALPIIELATSATNARDAVGLNEKATGALRRYLDREQNRSGTPSEQRVRLDMFAAPAGAVLVEGRSLTTPMAAFLFALCAAVALAYALENVQRTRSSRYPIDDGLPADPDDGDPADDLLFSAPVAHIERKSA